MRIFLDETSLYENYLFVVVVSSLDGRSASKTVSVAPIASGSAELSITSAFTRFNVGSKLSIIGSLSASYPVTAVWSVYNTLGANVTFTALTAVKNSFSLADARSNIIFPLSIAAGVLAGGSAYSFRLTAYPTSDSSIQSFTQIILIANSPPTGGYVASKPVTGSALVTPFVISSPGWTTDAANFPLSLSFAYRLSAASSYLTLAALSLRAFTTSTLPAGLDSQSNLLTLQGQAVDIYSASAVATASVHVIFNSTTDVSNVLSSGLSNAFSFGDVNLALQTVNNVSSFTDDSLFSPQYRLDRHERLL